MGLMSGLSLNEVDAQIAKVPCCNKMLCVVVFDSLKGGGS